MKTKTKNNIEIGNTRFLITGGSGSLGRNIIKKLLSLGAKNIISISRDENLIKQAENEIASPFVKFKLGDITDKEFISNILKEIDFVFNTAAVKHVSLAEQNPREAYRVNIVGLLNLLNSSSSIKRFIHVSSDKAIGVMNCYGSTKLLGEYLVKESNDLYKGSQYFLVRCPNFLGSRGSVLDIWKEQLKKENKIKISDPDMTRYFITLSDAAKFVVDVGLDKKSDTKKIPYPTEYTRKFRLKDLAEAFLEVFGNKTSKIEVTGASSGEKTHEDYIKDFPITPVKGLVKLIKETSIYTK